MKSMRRVAVLGAMVCSTLPIACQAQESTAVFPARPVTLVVPAQPGASDFGGAAPDRARRRYGIGGDAA